MSNEMDHEKRELCSEGFQTSTQKSRIKIKHLPEGVPKQFLGNVILAVGVLKGKIELVVSIQHLETFGFCGTWTLLGATITVDIDRYIFL